MLGNDKTDKINLFGHSYKSEVENQNFMSISREMLLGDIGLVAKCPFS